MDLPLGELVIGRSASCGLTIDDPLVSRSHARISVSEKGACIEDAGSRNGIRVNGRMISGRAKLTDGARFRIGTQEFLFRCIEESQVQLPRRQATGFMIHCPQCKLPYATEMKSCPHCHEDELNALDEEPTTTTEQAWSIELLAETMHRAMALGRKDDIERLLIQARGLLDHTKVTIDRRRLDQLADGALLVATATDNVSWARWALCLYSTRGIAPGSAVGQQFISLPPLARESLAPAFSEVVRSLRPDSAGGESVDEKTMQMLRELSQAGEGPI